MRPPFALLLVLLAACEQGPPDLSKPNPASTPTASQVATAAPAPTPEKPQIPAPPDVAAPPADAEKTPSGLASKVLQKGTGTEKPTSDSKVKVHYTGWTTDGKMFDSSVQRGTPATFKLDQVIKGWGEALPLMKTGSKWQLFIPASLAYGERGAGQDIPPNAALIFEVELVSIQG